MKTGDVCARPPAPCSLDTCAQNTKRAAAYMLRRGFHEADIKKVLGENFLRVFEQTWRK